MLINENKVIRMEKAFPLERKNQILDIIRHKGRVTVDELKEVFKVSGATIRRDLEFLERQGLITRAHGGAIIRGKVALEPDYFEEKQKFLEEKIRIGKEASKMVEEGEVIFLEASTTVLQMAKFLRDKRELSVITNSLEIAQELRGIEGISLVVIGGTLRKRTNSLIGPLAELSLSQMRFDKAFIGISALDPSSGITTPTLEEAQTKKEIVKAANQVIALCDHSKFGEQNFAFVMPLEKINILITDKGVSSSFKGEIEKKGIKVVVV